MSSLPLRGTPSPLRRSPSGDALLNQRWPWVLMAIAVGAILGVGIGVGGVALGVGICLLPIGLAVVLRPDWLPAALAVTVFAESASVGGLSVSRAAGPLALALLMLQIRPRSPVSFARLDKPLAISITLYILWACASSLWTVNLDPSLAEGGTGFAVTSLLLSAVYLVAVSGLVRTEQHVFRLIVVIWALSAVMGLIALGEFARGSERAVGVSGDANFFASLQIVAIPVGAVLAGYVRNGLQRAVVLLGVGIAVGSVIVSLSRGGILALAALTIMLAMQPARGFFRTRARKRMFLGVMTVGAALLLTLSYSALSARTSSLFNTADGGSGRTNLWRAAATGIHEYPVFGLGYGAFENRSNDLMRESPGVDFSAYKLRSTGQPVHNAYLESWVELGPLGIGLFIGMLVFTFRAFRRTAKIADEEDGSDLIGGVARALQLSLVGFALTSILLSTETDRTLWLMMGLALTLPRIATATTAPGRRST